MIKRRDKIGRAYLTEINPVTGIRLDGAGTLTFENAAVDHDLAREPAHYSVSFNNFDNVTGEATPLGQPITVTERRARAPRGMSSAAGDFVVVRIAAIAPDHPGWAVPVEAYFRRSPRGWTLVGLDRLTWPRVDRLAQSRQ